MKKPYKIMTTEPVLFRYEEYVVLAENEEQAIDLIKESFPYHTVKSIEAFEGCSSCGGCGSKDKSCG